MLGREVDLFDPASFNPATDGVTLTEDIRSRPADPELWGGRTDHYGVGGHVELVTASAAGLSSRLLKTWPEDRVGRRIRPR